MVRRVGGAPFQSVQATASDLGSKSSAQNVVNTSGALPAIPSQGTVNHGLTKSPSKKATANAQKVEALDTSGLKLGAKPSEIRAAAKQQRDKVKLEQIRKDKIRRREEDAAMRMQKIKDEIANIKKGEAEQKNESSASVEKDRATGSKKEMAPETSQMEIPAGPKFHDEQPERRFQSRRPKRQMSVEETEKASRGTKDLALEELLAQKSAKDRAKKDKEREVRKLGGKALEEMREMNESISQITTKPLPFSAQAAAVSRASSRRTELVPTTDGKLEKMPSRSHLNPKSRSRRAPTRKPSLHVPEMRRRANPRDLMFDEDDMKKQKLESEEEDTTDYSFSALRSKAIQIEESGIQKKPPQNPTVKEEERNKKQLPKGDEDTTDYSFSALRSKAQQIEELATQKKDHRDLVVEAEEKKTRHSNNDDGDTTDYSFSALRSKAKQVEESGIKNKAAMDAHSHHVHEMRHQVDSQNLNKDDEDETDYSFSALRSKAKQIEESGIQRKDVIHSPSLHEPEAKGHKQSQNLNKQAWNTDDSDNTDYSFSALRSKARQIEESGIQRKEVIHEPSLSGPEIKVGTNPRGSLVEEGAKKQALGKDVEDTTDYSFSALRSKAKQIEGAGNQKKGIIEKVEEPKTTNNRWSVDKPNASRQKVETKDSTVVVTSAPKPRAQRKKPPQKTELDKAKEHFEIGHDLCWKNNDSAGALVEYRKALFTRESLLGKYHEETGRTYFWIGKSLTKLQEFDEALMAFSRAMRIFERVLKKNNKYNIWTITAIESVFRKMEDPHMEFEDYRESLEESTRHEQIGDQFRKKGMQAEAIAEYREAVDLLEEYHPDAADLFCKIAIIMRQQGEFDKALEEYRYASEIYELSLGTEHPDTVKTLNQLIEKKRLNQKSMALMEKLKFGGNGASEP